MFIVIDCEINHPERKAEIYDLGVDNWGAFTLLLAHVREFGNPDGSFYYGKLPHLQHIMCLRSARKLSAVLHALCHTNWMQIDRQSATLTIHKFLKFQRLLKKKAPQKGQNPQGDNIGDNNREVLGESLLLRNKADDQSKPGLRADFFDVLIAFFEDKFSYDDFVKVKQFAGNCWRQGGTLKEPVILQIIGEVLKEKGKWVAGAAYSKWRTPSIPEQERQSEAIKKAHWVAVNDLTAEMKSTVENFGKVSER